MRQLRLLWLAIFPVSLMLLGRVGPATAQPLAQAMAQATACPGGHCCPTDTEWNETEGRCTKTCLSDQVRDGDQCYSLDKVTRGETYPLMSVDAETGMVTYGATWSSVANNRIAAAQVRGAPGCVQITRSPWPRAMVGIRTDFTVKGIVPAEQMWLPLNAGGYILQPPVDWRVSYIAGQATFGDLTKVDLKQGLGLRYPSIDNVRLYLQFDWYNPKVVALSIQPSNLKDNVKSIEKCNTLPDGLDMIGAFSCTFTRSSYPRGAIMEGVGPARNLSNSLPAYRLTGVSSWLASLVMRWDTCTIVDHDYRCLRSSAEKDERGIFIARRVWGSSTGDVYQTRTGNSSFICSNSLLNAYVPVPVIEAQGVLVP